MDDSIKNLTELIVEFRDARDWKQFHNPKDMSISIVLEAAELLEVFQWSGSDIEVNNEKQMSMIKEELADILIYALLMGYDLGLNISEIIKSKIDVNNQKYPVEKSYGKSDKYKLYSNPGGESDDSL